MKRFHALLTIALVCISTRALFAEATPGIHDHGAEAAPATQPADATEAATADAKATFTQLKALEGTWEGGVTTTPPQPEVQGKVARLSLRVMSRGHSLLHDLKMEGIPDNPLTVFYVDEERLRLTHYCDAGNRPRMEGKASADGKTVEFGFLDLAGGNHYGHMHNAVFTLIDADHHVEEWTYMLPGDKPVRARLDLRRVK
jgi:hypothetical protein